MKSGEVKEEEGTVEGTPAAGLVPFQIQTWADELFTTSWVTGKTFPSFSLLLPDVVNFSRS